MPTLNWIGKDKVINHHMDVPYRILEHSYGFDNGTQSQQETNSGNKIIHGDNLEVLKALLPEYEGKIKCIYIDPPYNTGNEEWVYNDNVNDPKIKKWLGKVVGKEADDLSRHDKWLCMMYPRLKLLHKLLDKDGTIFISIDEYEHDYLHLIVDEIFGRSNRIQTFVWKKTYGGGAKSKHSVNLHEYVLFYAKDINKIDTLELPPNDSILKYYKLKDEKFEKRGPFRLQPLSTNSMDARPNLRYPILFNNEEIWPEKQWQWSKDRAYKALETNELIIEKNKKTGKWTVNYKQYLKNEEGTTRGRKIYSILDEFYTQHGTNELTSIFGQKTFNFPKPPELIKTFLSLVTDTESTILDSFAGSGTTAHAVLKLNKEDGGNRKCILVEMEEYAENITAERVKRVIKGYGEDKKAIDGTGGNFDFYELGKPLFLDNDMLNEEVGLEKIREYVWFSETRKPYEAVNDKEKHLLGIANSSAYYFYYYQDKLTTLDDSFMRNIKTKAEQYIIYADNCVLDEKLMQKYHITFKKIPRDITRF